MSKPLTTEEFIKRAKNLYNHKYDYSISEYKTNNTKIQIICPKHGKFNSRPGDHLQGKSGCPKCRLESMALRLSVPMPFDEFVEKSSKKHNGKYDYSLSKNEYKNGKSKITITCPRHGLFKQLVESHLFGYGCRLCRTAYRQSKCETKWLNAIGLPDDNRHRQVKIDNFIVDGYDPETRTVYEFYGDFWHGNSSKYTPNKLNPLANKTFGELNRQTIQKEKLLESLGYHIVRIWEHDFYNTYDFRSVLERKGKMKHNIELSYDSIQLIPNFCIVDSRSECDTSLKFGRMTFKIPVVPANMKTIITEDLARYLAKDNYFYIMHRFGVDNLAFCKRMIADGLYTSISIGVNSDSFKSLTSIANNGISPEFITIDVANAWSIKARSAINVVKHLFPDTFLIVGNVATQDAVQQLEEWGADAVKVGIANGHVCITRHKTGFGRPSISTLQDCCAVAKKPIIADGGIKQNGDIAKALTFGAKMVMAGSIFAGHDETYGDAVEIGGHKYKEYYGSASEHNKGIYKNVEGKKILTEYKGPISRTLNEIKEDLQSSISYAGGKDLSAFHGVGWVVVQS